MRFHFGLSVLVLFGGCAVVASARDKGPALAGPEAARVLPAHPRPLDAKQLSPEERTRLVETWRQQTQDRLSALRRSAAENAQSKPRAEIPMIRQVEIPEAATPAMEELIVQQAQIRNSRAALVNTLRDAAPETRAEAVRQWHDRNQAALLAFQQQAAVVAAESRQKPLSTPPPLRIPDGASPGIQDFLPQRHAHLLQFIEQENAVRRLPPAQQAAARHRLRSRENARPSMLFPADKNRSLPESPTQPNP